MDTVGIFTKILPGSSEDDKRRIQLYWPRILISKTELYLKFSCVLRASRTFSYENAEYRKARYYSVAITLFGFGVGLDRMILIEPTGAAMSNYLYECMICGKELEACDTYEYRGAYSCAEHFDEVQGKREQ